MIPREINEVELYNMEVAARKHLPNPMINNLKVDTREVFDGIMYDLRAYVLHEDLTEIKFPSNWLEAVKERFFPNWLKEKYPVNYTVYTAKALYPYVSLPEHWPTVKLFKQRGFDNATN